MKKQKEYFVKLTIREDGAVKVDANLEEKDIYEFVLTALVNLERLSKQKQEVEVDVAEEEVE